MILETKKRAIFARQVHRPSVNDLVYKQDMVNFHNIAIKQTLFIKITENYEHLHKTQLK